MTGKANQTTGEKEQPKRFHAFLAHDWGVGPEFANHKRVSRINKELKRRGIDTWFDEDRMTGQIKKQMSQGVTNSEVIIIFITQRYNDKISSPNDQDNCQFEYNLATTKRGASNMIAVVVEEQMKDMRAWDGQLCGDFARQLYVDATDEGSLEQTVDKIVDELCNRIAGLREWLDSGRTYDYWYHHPPERPLANFVSLEDQNKGFPLASMQRRAFVLAFLLLTAAATLSISMISSVYLPVSREYLDCDTVSFLPFDAQTPCSLELWDYDEDYYPRQGSPAVLYYTMKAIAGGDAESPVSLPECPEEFNNYPMGENPANLSNITVTSLSSEPCNVAENVSSIFGPGSLGLCQAREDSELSANDLLKIMKGCSQYLSDDQSSYGLVFASTTFYAAAWILMLVQIPEKRDWTIPLLAMMCIGALLNVPHSAMASDYRTLYDISGLDNSSSSVEWRYSEDPVGALYSILNVPACILGVLAALSEGWLLYLKRQA